MQCVCFQAVGDHQLQDPFSAVRLSRAVGHAVCVLSGCWRSSATRSCQCSEIE